MELRSGLLIVIALLFTFFMTYTTTPLVRKLSIKVGAVDIPKDNRRMHSKPIPTMGGLAIFVAFAFGVIVFVPMDSTSVSYTHLDVYKRQTLVITLTPKTAQSENAYFVGLNAYEEYEQNLITAELGFTPTMCEGLSDIILISSPKKDEASAKKLADETNLKIASVAPAKQAYVFEMSMDALPRCV